MSDPQIEIYTDKKFAAAVADEIVAAITDVLHDKDTCALCLSGGTTPAKVYRLLTLSPRVGEIEWPKVKLFFGDERWVPKDSAKSNYRMVHETLLSRLPQDSLPDVFDLNTETSSALESAKMYQESLRLAGYDFSEGSSFDIVLLGLGSDGHFASIFPGDYEKACTSTEHVIATKSPSDDTDRMSLAPSALFSAKKLFFLVAGEGKAEVVSSLFKSLSSRGEYPASHAFDFCDKVLWMFDSSAAVLLER